MYLKRGKSSLPWGGGISGHILTNVLRHLGDMELYDNDRESGILLVMLIDGHGSRFDLFFCNTVLVGAEELVPNEQGEGVGRAGAGVDQEQHEVLFFVYIYFGVLINQSIDRLIKRDECRGWRGWRRERVGEDESSVYEYIYNATTMSLHENYRPTTDYNRFQK